MEQPTGPAHILVVDDDPVMLQLLWQILSPLGDVITAENGRSALAKLRDIPVDVVLLDVDMPGMNGIELCMAIKADPAFADLPVLFISGHHDVETEERGLRAGAVDY